MYMNGNLKNKMKTVIDVCNLKIGYRTGNGINHVIEGMSFSLKENEILALVGGSGCGKTTLCKAFAGILGDEAAISGTVSHEADGNIAMVFQDPYLSLDPTQAIGKQIEETVLIHIGKHLTGGKDKKEFARRKSLELLDLVGIEDPEKRYDQIPMYFSGGMRQRVAIAIALAMEPDVIIGDELTSSLDEENQEQMINLLNDLRDRLDTAVIIATHDLGLVEDHCDRVIIIKDGTVTEEGPANRVFAKPQSDYTKDLLKYAGYRKGTEHTHGDLHFHEGEPHSHEHKDGHKHDDIDPSISRDPSLGHTPHLIEISNLSKSYKPERQEKIEVLHDLSFNIHKGEMLGLSGKSGAGKTTLAKCLVGLESPDSGEIKYSYELKRKNSIQMIFQDSKSALDPRMSVKETLAEAVKLNGQNRDQSISELLAMFELEKNLLTKRPYEISGGQRQRVAIARAVAMDPAFLIADEPISSLDMVVQAQMIHLLRRIREEKDLTVLMISHDIPMLMHVCDRIISL